MIFISEQYEDLDYTNYPNDLDDNITYQDASADTQSLVTQYYNLKSAGSDSEANALIEANPILKTIIINAETMQRFNDRTIALERFYMSDVQSYIMNAAHYKGVWNASTKYQRYDFVTYSINSKPYSFECIQLNTPIGTLPTNSSYFIQITLQGEQGISGTGLSPRGVWDISVQYYKDDCVAYDNKLWSALQDNIGQTPVEDSTYWVFLMQLKQQVAVSSTQPINQVVGDLWYQII